LVRTQRYGDEFRDEAVRIVGENGHSRLQLARELGINPSTMANWVRKYAERKATRKREERAVKRRQGGLFAVLMHSE